MNPKTLTRTALATLAMTAAFSASAMVPAGEADPFVDQQGHPLAGAMDTSTSSYAMVDSSIFMADEVSPEQELAARAASVAARDEVRQEAAELRTAGALTRPGEITEPRAVLMARQLLNEEQAESIRASYLAEQARLAAAEPEMVTVAVVTPVIVFVDPE